MRASQGVDWSWSQCIKSHHAQTSSGKGLPSHATSEPETTSEASYLGCWEKELSGLKSSFQMKVNFAFNLETRSQSLEEEWRGNRIHVAWSPVWSFHSQWWFGCHVICWCWSTCVFWSPQSTTRYFIYQEILEHFMLPSADKLYGDADSFCSRTWHLPTLPKVPKAGSMTMVLLCLIGQQTRLTWTP